MEEQAGHRLHAGSRSVCASGSLAVLTESRHGCQGCFSFTHCHNGQSDGFESLVAREDREHGEEEACA